MQKQVQEQQPGQKIAVVSPSMAGPAYGEAVHRQAMARLEQLTGRKIVEYPCTSKLMAASDERAQDINDAFANPQIGAIMATVGGNDQITILRHLKVEQIKTGQGKLFFGYSDNTHLHNWLWKQGINSIYGGSTQVQIGPGPQVDPEHAQSLLAALNGEDLLLQQPSESEDHGHDWMDPKALTCFGDRTPTEPWQWAGPKETFRGRTWGGCVQVLQDILMAGHNPADSELEGTIALFEFADDNLQAPMLFQRFLINLGERGLLARFKGIVMARPPATTIGYVPSLEQQQQYRNALAGILIAMAKRYAPQAILCMGVPFGHTRPQLLMPYGGEITLDGKEETVIAHYGSCYPG